MFEHQKDADAFRSDPYFSEFKNRPPPKELFDSIFKDCFIRIGGPPGIGKSVQAQIIASNENFKDYSVHWLNCSSDSKIEYAFKAFARRLNLSPKQKIPSEIINEICEQLNTTPRKYLIILNDVVSEDSGYIATMLRNRCSAILIIMSMKKQTNEDIRFKINFYGPYTAKQSFENAVQDLKGIFAYENEIVVDELDFKSGSILALQQHILRSHYLDMSVCVYLALLDGDFIEENFLCDLCTFDAIDETKIFQILNIIRRCDDAQSFSGFAIHSSLQESMLYHVRSGPYFVRNLKKILTTVNRYMRKIFSVNYYEVERTHHAYFHGVKLLQFEEHFESVDFISLLNSLTMYQSFWLVDKELCLELERKKVDVLEQYTGNRTIRADEVYFSVAISLLAFDYGSEANEWIQKANKNRSENYPHKDSVLIFAFFRIGLRYSELKEHAIAMYYLDYCLKYLDSVVDTPEAYEGLVRLRTQVLRVFADFYDKKGKRRVAKKHLKKIKVKRNAHRRFFHENLSVIGWFKVRWGKEKKALKYYDAALDAFKTKMLPDTVKFDYLLALKEKLMIILRAKNKNLNEARKLIYGNPYFNENFLKKFLKIDI